MKNKNIFISAFFCLLFLVPFGVFSQGIEPEDAGIELPPLILEIADIQNEQIEAFLPTEEDVSPLISIILPEAGALPFSDSLFSMRVQDTVSVSSRGNSFFSEGSIGVGSRNHILGDITLYKTGAQPRFNLRFYHEQWDGFQGRDAGEGFSSRDDGIIGNLSYAMENWKIDALGSFKQNEWGLQGQSDYFTLSHRSYNFKSEGEYQISSLWLVKGGIGFNGAVSLLTSDAPVMSDELSIKPEVAFSAQWSKYNLTLSGNYNFTNWHILDGTSFPDHSGDIYLSFNAELPSYLDLALEAGMALHQGISLRFPFSVELAGQFSRSVSFYLEGGYKSGVQSYLELWEENPFLDIKALTPAFHWYGTLGLSWFAGQYITADTALEFRASEGEIALASLTPQNNGLFAVTQVDVYSLTPSLDLRFRIFQGFTITAGWRSRFLDTQSIYQGHNINFALSYESENGTFGSSLTGDFDFYPEMGMPELKLDGFYRFSEGVLFLFELRDLLAPFTTDGRVFWSPYIEPGFAFVFKTQISL